MFLIHVTLKGNLNSIINHGYLEPDIQERYDQGLYLESGQNVKEKLEEGGQFPGVYFLLSDQQSIDNYTWLDKNDVILVFPLSMLDQNNYHVNIADQFGLINEKTIFPSMLHRNPCLIYRIIYEPNNEVVFHDKIPMSYCCGVIEYPFDTTNIICKEIQPDYETLPFYAFHFAADDPILVEYYSDFEKNKELYQRLCGLVQPFEECKKKNSLQEMQNYMFNDHGWKYYYNNRHLQNLKDFKEWNAYDLK